MKFAHGVDCPLWSNINLSPFIVIRAMMSKSYQKSPIKWLYTCMFDEYRVSYSTPHLASIIYRINFYHYYYPNLIIYKLPACKTMANWLKKASVSSSNSLAMAMYLQGKGRWEHAYTTWEFATFFGTGYHTCLCIHTACHSCSFTTVYISMHTYIHIFIYHCHLVVSTETPACCCLS